MVFAIKMLLNNIYGLLRTSLNSYVIILIVSFKQNLNLEIQILAGNPVNSWFSAGSQISSTLVKTTHDWHGKVYQPNKGWFMLTYLS